MAEKVIALPACALCQAVVLVLDCKNAHFSYCHAHGATISFFDHD